MNDLIDRTIDYLARLKGAATLNAERRSAMPPDVLQHTQESIQRLRRKLGFATDEALTIGVDGYDADGDPLTISVESDNPELSWFVPTGNRFARLHFVSSDGVTDIGDIVVELFETRTALAAERFITLATNYVDPDTGELDPGGVPFYTDVVVHRVIPGFMVQSGDAAEGTGGGGSPLGAFPDVFDPDLNFLLPGVLAMANSGPDIAGSSGYATSTPVCWRWPIPEQTATTPSSSSPTPPRPGCTRRTWSSGT